jgi:hypothetical protein
MGLPHIWVQVKGKAILVTGRGGPQGCEASRLPNFLDNRLRDGDEVVKPYTPAASYLGGHSNSSHHILN